MFEASIAYACFAKVGGHSFSLALKSCFCGPALFSSRNLHLVLQRLMIGNLFRSSQPEVEDFHAQLGAEQIIDRLQGLQLIGVPEFRLLLAENIERPQDRSARVGEVQAIVLPDDQTGLKEVDVLKF